MKSLSDVAYQIDGQPMFKILDLAQKLEREGREILHFELGEPDFDTPSNISFNVPAYTELVKKAKLINKITILFIVFPSI